jgi:hypothetical protein
LETAVADIEQRFGVRAGGGGRHVGQGTHNKLLALGARTYLEVAAPDPEQPEPAAPRPYGVDGVTTGGLVGWALTCDDIDAALATTRAKGFDPGDVIEGQRVTPTGTVLRWRLTSNALTAGPIPFSSAGGRHPIPPPRRRPASRWSHCTSSTLIPRASGDLSMPSAPTWRSTERRRSPSWFAFEVHVASTSSDEPVGPTRDHPTPLGIRTCRFQGD